MEASKQTPPESIMQFFAYGHLPPHLQEVSKPFGELAQQLVSGATISGARTVSSVSEQLLTAARNAGVYSERITRPLGVSWTAFNAQTPTATYCSAAQAIGQREG